MEVTIPIGEVEALLVSRDHTLDVDNSDSGCLALSPPEEIYLTVALRPDAVLFRRWRQRYFLCKPDPASILTRSSIAEPFRQRWQLMLGEIRPPVNFDGLKALATLTFTRLFGCDRIFMWLKKPNRYYPDYRSEMYSQIEQYIGSTVGSGRWRRHLDTNPWSHALVLDPRDEEFPYLIAAYFLYSSNFFSEVYFSRDDVTEVYEMHHHDKLIVSIPDPFQRTEFLSFLTTNSAIFEDRSNYEMMEELEHELDEEGNWIV